MASKRHLCLDYYCSLGKGGKGGHVHERRKGESSRRHTGFVAAGVLTRGFTLVFYFLHWQGRKPRSYSVLRASLARKGSQQFCCV